MQPSVPDPGSRRQRLSKGNNGADPQAEFAHYQGIIIRARRKVEKTLDKAERYFRLTAGPALIEIHRGESYKEVGFTTWAAVAELFGMSVRRTYQLMESVRAMEWLEPITSEVPSERQLRAILPVGDKHGADAARKVWKLAEERGKTSGTALEQAAIDLGFQKALEPPAGPETAAVETVWPRYEPVFRALEDLRGLRQVALEAPERARELVARLRTAADELAADIPPEGDGS